MCDVYVLRSGRHGCRCGEWMRELGLGFTNPVGTGGVLYVCVFWLRWWGVGMGLGPGFGGVGCYV